ncbi:MAG: endonuclease MutS2 [Deltaproteobacteria bacterium]
MSHQLYQTLEFDKVLDDLARRARSSLGAERLKHLRPLPDPEQVRKSLGRISELRTFLDSGGLFPITTFQDIGRYLELAAAEGSYLEPDAFGHIHQVLILTERLHHLLSQNRSDFPLLQEVGAPLTPNPSLVQAIGKCIDLKSSAILDHASSSLAGIRRKIAVARERLRKDLEAVLDRLWHAGVLQDRLITMRQGRWVLPVKETHRHRIKGVLHDQSASGVTLFIEPIEILELNNQVRRLEADERQEIERILRRLTDLVRVNRAGLKGNLDVLVAIDCIHAMVLTSMAMHQHEPAVDIQGRLKIKNGQHPLLLMKANGQYPVVPLDLAIGEDFNTLVITGPNAGGKTVALKTVGLLALMVSCGLHIPADPDSQVPIFGQIFAHVGDAQSIEMDLSTFSAHVTDIKRVVDESAPGDLVLIDEVGTGTDPQEGVALAMAVLEALTGKGVLTIVTTHHGTLKAFAHQTPGMANGSMAFDTEHLTPTYKFIPDLPGSSYALEIAKRMGLRDDIIARSRSLMGDQAHRLEDLIQGLQDHIMQNEQLEEDLKTQKRVLEELTAHYQQEKDRLAREAKQLHRKAAEEAERIIGRANAAVEKAIQTIKEKQASREAISQAKAIVQEQREGLKKELEAASWEEDSGQDEQVMDAKAVSSGNRVYWRRGGIVAHVLSGEDATGHVLIARGNLKIRVPKAELAPVKGQETTAPDHYPHVSVPSPETVQTEIDIRGMQVEEALEAVDRFVNDALLAGLMEVRVIHGVGTGALRKNVIPFLKQHPLVQMTLPGGPYQKNLGVTVVRVVAK